jgi:PAS domain S-box-containing protein
VQPIDKTTSTAIVHDNTHMQDDLHALEQRWGLALQTAGFGVWDLDVPAQTVHYSPQWQQALGYTSDGGADSTSVWRARVHPDDLPAMMEALGRHLRGDAAHYTHEFRLRAADGSWRWVLSRGRVVQRGPDGQPLRAVGTMTDMTDRRELEGLRVERDRAEAASQAKTEFLSRMSHELRTPLNAVLGFAQLLARPDVSTPPDDQRRYAQHIEHAGWQLLRMVDDALDLASLEGGRLRLVPQPLDLQAAVQAALQEVGSVASRCGVRLLGPTLPPAARVLADPSRLQQVLSHLLHNAARHNHPGGEVELSVQPRPGSWLVTVRDTGPGMTADQLQHLFEPFNRLGRPAGARLDSVGLGLALVRSLLRGMGGDVVAHSTPGAGSRFEISLPAA